MSSNPQVLTLKTLLGDYPNTLPLKRGEVKSPRIVLQFADVKVINTAFKRVVRDLEFDVAELAIATFLQAKAHGKPLVAVPAVIVGGKSQHASIVYNSERGELAPKDIVGRRVGIRASSQTTVAWVRGILQNDYGVDLERVKWISFEDPHVAEYHDPANVERAASGKKLVNMLREGEVDAAVLSGDDLKDPRFRSLVPDAAAAAKEWNIKHQMLPINHMLVVKQSLSQEHPWAVREVFDLIAESKKKAGLPTDQSVDALRLGVEPNRRGLQMMINYAVQQHLIPRRMEVDELFDDVTRVLGK